MDCESLSLMGEKKPEMERLPGVSDQSEGPKETPLKRSKGWLGLQAETREQIEAPLRDKRITQ